MQNFNNKKSMPNRCLCKIGVKWPICPNQLQVSLLEISYIPLLSVMTLHYHRLYQVSSTEANLSLEDMKQLSYVDRNHLHRYTYPKTNN